MEKSFFIIAIIVLGLFFRPSEVFACKQEHDTIEKKSECTKKDSSSHEEKCCKEAHSKKEKNDKECSEKCKSISCHCQTIKTNITYLSLESVKQYFQIEGKKSFFYLGNHPVSGFNFIWIPPKIS